MRWTRLIDVMTAFRLLASRDFKSKELQNADLQLDHVRYD